MHPIHWRSSYWIVSGVPELFERTIYSYHIERTEVVVGAKAYSNVQVGRRGRGGGAFGEAKILENFERIMDGPKDADR